MKNLIMPVMVLLLSIDVSGCYVHRHDRDYDRREQRQYHHRRHEDRDWNRRDRYHDHDRDDHDRDK